MLMPEPKLREPVLALTADRARKAQTNDFCGDPKDWFDSPFFREHHLFAASFDFFVNWEDESICDEVWIKRISDTDQILEQDEAGLLKLIADCDGSEKSNRLYCFFRHHGLAEKYMLFRDVPEYLWESGQEKVVELDLSRYKRGSVSHFDAGEIQDKIRKLRRRPAAIGNAGLVYSTSSLEGYLSKKQYFWPGDTDTVLYDDNDQAAAVIEFKKHTANSRIPFAEQRLANYLKRDILKYKSLALLRDRFHTDLFVLYYPIPANIDYVIIEKIEGSPDALYASERYQLDLPDKSRVDHMKAFTERFITDVLSR